MSQVSAEFATLLADQRELLNERFALRKRSGARIETEAFFHHLRESVEPLVLQVHARFPERAPGVLTALYDASLDLFAADLLGSESKLPIMRRIWTDLLPGALQLLAREPATLIGCLCNAMYQVCQQRDTKPQLWLTRLGALLPECTSIAEVIDAGLVVAWQAGMPQFREPALTAASRMKPKASALALGLTDETKVPAVIESLKQDRWFRIGSKSSRGLVPVALAGAFTGFGGLFGRPPKVTCLDGHLVAAVEDRSHWQLIADAYGVWFRRIKETKIKSTPLPRDVSVDANGTVHWGKLSLKAPHLAKPSSVACDGATLAVTIPTSHHLFLFAPTGGPV